MIFALPKLLVATGVMNLGGASTVTAPGNITGKQRSTIGNFASASTAASPSSNERKASF